MKKILVGLPLLLLGCDGYYDKAHSDVYLTTSTGLGQKIGEIYFMDTPSGLLVNVDLKDLPAGEHGFHIHENPDCGVMNDDNGNPQPGLKAGGHYDPDKTGRHLGPNQTDGHRKNLQKN